MLCEHTLLSRDGITVCDVACRHDRGDGRSDEHSGAHAIVFVRRGCFVRTADGVRALLDPTVAYAMNPGEEQRYDHPHDGGDDCTALFLDADLVTAVWGGDPRLPAGPLATTPALDVEHRVLLARLRRGADGHELAERALGLVARTLARRDAGRVDSGRPATARARRALADDAREALAADPGRPLPELAGDLAVSPHHLSRVFRAQTGETISRHRLRLRARTALERLAGGEHDLARVAADAGFCDQSHLCRVLGAETASTPAALRRALSCRP